MRLLVLIFASLWWSHALAQTTDRLQNAFVQSYDLERNGDFRKAADALREVYSNDSYEVNLRLGWLNYHAGLFDDSKAFYRRALQILPLSEEARFGILLPLSATGEWDEAIRYYQEILSNNPVNTLAMYRLGLIYYGKRDWLSAQRQFQKVVDLYPFGYDGLLMLAWTNLQLGRNREATVLFNKVLLYAPGDSSALEGLSLIK